MTEIQKKDGRNGCRNGCRNGWNDQKDKEGNNDRYNAEMISGLENLPEDEDCSSAVLPDTSEPGEGQKKVVISDPVSMGKYLFDNYRVDLYTYLNKLLWNGTLSGIVGCRVLNRVLNNEAVDFPGVSFWRINRENFYSDVSVELKLKTTVGSLTWNGVIEIWCSFEGDFTLSFESLGRSVDREGFDRLSTFLVPYFTNRRVDEVAEQLWLRYIPEALNDPDARKAEKLAECMGLKVLHRDIYEHRGVKGIIFFAEDELLVGEDRYETDEDGNRILVKTEHPVKERIPANTIVINTNKIKKDYSEFHVFHECIHNEFHYLFFRLQQMGNNDPRRMKTKTVIVDKSEEIKDEMYFIEKQANRGAYGLMMPATDTRRRFIEECGRVKNSRHLGEKYEIVGKALGTALHMPHFHIRARMIQLGYIEAKGSLNYVERKLIRPFAFNPESWRESEHTYVVDPLAVSGLRNSNDDLKKLMEGGDYVYETETSRTIDTGGNAPDANQGGVAICEPVAYGIGKPAFTSGEKAGFNFAVNEEVSPTLQASGPDAVAQPEQRAFGICGKYSHSMMSDNPNSGFYEAETARTIDTSNQCPAKNQGGVVVVEGNGARPSHQGNGYSESETMYTLNTIEQHAVAFADTHAALSANDGPKGPSSQMLSNPEENFVSEVAYGIDRASYNMGKNAQFGMVVIDEEVEPTLVAKGAGAVGQPVYHSSKNSYHTHFSDSGATDTLVATDYKDPPTVIEEPYYIVRRLTPTECARLQGFPDWWCAGLETEEPTEDEIAFWEDVFETHRKVMGTSSKPKTRNQIIKWLKNPHSDSAEYRLWGNGVAEPVVHYVLAGIAYYSQVKELYTP